VATLGPTSQTLSQFGFEPRKPRKRTAVAKAAAAQKSRATRAERHTMGPRQKAAIRGTVDKPDKPDKP
jgi:hypothetical protein